MKTAKEIAQWVIDNRYAKSENEKVSDVEMYHELVESIEKLCNIHDVSKSCPCCDGTGYCEGEHHDDLQACLTCGGSGHVC
ncbi:MAG: hypothetical protein WCX73_04325 [Candidatus Pacearchaeota archaeon]|jgi:DnaJ-class molecular chaperone